MLYVTLTNRELDLSRLSEPERHVAQKVIAWEKLGVEAGEFDKKYDKALRDGWGESGAVSPSAGLRALAEDARLRLGAARADGRADWLRPQRHQGAYGGGGLAMAGRQGGELRLVAHDALGRARGQVTLPLAQGAAEGEALRLALTELAEGGGPLAAQVRGLGLEVRPARE